MFGSHSWEKGKESMRNLKRIGVGLLSSAAILLSSVPLQLLAAADETSQGFVAPEDHIALSRQAAAEGMVLLENDGALPLGKGSTVALFGRGQIDFVKGGGGSGDVTTAYVRNLLQGMQIKEENGQISLYAPLVEAYTSYVSSHDSGEMPLDDDLLAGAAAAADTALVTISRYSEEGSDRSAGKGDYLLSDAEEEMLEKVTTAGFDKVAVVLNIGGIIDTSWIETYCIDAVLVAWQPGIEGGLAAADILCGDVSPSGKLTDTFAKSYEDYPSAENFLESSNYVNYTEDIFVGYRYFETIPGMKERVAYPFGYGLSYTTFDLTDVQITEKDGAITVSVKVTNTGDVAGKEVVQVYFEAPQKNGVDVFLDKSARELAAFDKTNLLQPGESQVLTMTYSISDMSSYDDTGKTGIKSAYVLEPGDYHIYVGNSVRDAGDKGVRYTYTVDSLTVTEQLTEQLTPTRLEKRMLSDGTYEQVATDAAQDVPADGKTLIEAESFTAASPEIRIESFDTASGSGRSLADMSGAGRYVTYTLDVAQAGYYRVVLRAANGLGAIDDMLTVYVDGVKQEGVRLDLPQTGNITGEGEWWNFIDMDPFTVYLPEGTCVLKLEANGDCGNLDFFTLEKLSGKETLVSGVGQTKIEGEDWAAASPEVGTEDFDNASGTGTCVSNMSVPGRYISYNLYVTSPGTYRVVFRAANGLADIRDMMKVYVNDTLQEGIVFDMDVSSVDGNQWHNYVDTEPFTVTLPAGAVNLKFVSNDGFCNLDYFTLEKTGTGHVIAAQGGTKVEAEDYTAAAEGVRKENFGTGTCVADMHVTGRYVSYTLNVEQAGTYRVTPRLANGQENGIVNMMSVYVDGVLQDIGTYSVPYTGVEGNQWHNYIDGDPFTITLPQGTCTLKIVSKDSFCNFDYLTFERVETRSAGVLRTVSAQTNEEKILLVDVYNDPDKMDAFLAQLTDLQLANLCSGQPSVIRWNTGGFGNLAEYGIPNAQFVDGPAGVHTNDLCTAWPVATLLACTWDEDLLEQIGAAAAQEALSVGGSVWLAPAINIHRNPLCGRNFEYYSEDPYLSGRMAIALTKGTQSQGVGVSVKHFATNNKENNRNAIDSRVSERALREIYLKGFEMVVKEAKPWTVMSSYNLINGQEASERYDLLTTILREEWGFDGLVTTDWGNDSLFWKEILAGNNLKMNVGDPQNLLTAMDNGLLTRDDLENNVKVLLELMMKTAAFERQAVNPTYYPVTAIAMSRLDADNYTWLSAGIYPEDTSDEGGGRNLGSLAAGTWVSYSIEVEETGPYLFTPRIASEPGGGAFDILLDGEKIGSYQNRSSTGGWQSWITGDPVELTLSAGKHELTLSFTQSGLNLNWIQLAPKDLKPIVTGVFNPTDISVELGTTADRLTLPDTVQVSLSDGTTAQVEVTWNLTGYNGGEAGSYTLTGTLEIGNGLQNPQNLAASLRVTVEPVGEPQPSTPSDTTRPDESGNVPTGVAAPAAAGALLLVSAVAVLAFGKKRHL